MAPPWSATAYIALALIICGVLLPVAYGHWLATRIFEPLAMPISLRRGHIRSKDFYINFRGRYWVEVDVDYPFTYSHPECPIYGPESVLTAHFTVWRDGRVIEELDALHYWFAGMFEAHRKGYYRLDVEVTSDASCLDAAHPRVVVGTGPGSYSDLQDALRWLSLFMVLAGLGLLAANLVGIWRRRTGRAESRNFRAVRPLFHVAVTLFPWQAYLGPAAIRAGMRPGRGDRDDADAHVASVKPTDPEGSLGVPCRAEPAGQESNVEPTHHRSHRKHTPVSAAGLREFEAGRVERLGKRADGGAQSAVRMGGVCGGRSRLAMGSCRECCRYNSGSACESSAAWVQVRIGENGKGCHRQQQCPITDIMLTTA